MPFSYAVIQFSNPIIPFRILLFIFLILLCHYIWILLFSFQFCYSLLNYVMQFSNPINRLYSSVMQFRILLFPFKFCCSLFQFYYVLFPILLFAFELCSSKSGTSFIWPTAPWGPVTNWFPSIEKHGGLGRRRFAESITSLHKCNSNLIHQILTRIVTILYSTKL